ncbi:MAG: HAMP domain-containing sensor histidine kinase [Bacillota bacterium]|nr:HAMP domain-containing sensor histidine kinase [Bacillota bacterium]
MLKKEIFEAEKGKVITHLAASFGHEVRNPITATKGFLQLLLEKDITYEKRVLYAQTALDELKHSEMIISNYLTFAKPHVKKKKIFDFREEIEIVVETVFPMANMNNIVVNLISVSNISSKWIIDGERNLLHQCLLNILKNSIEAMPNGGVLKVELVRLERLIGVSISDTGIGMSNDQIKRLGESYFSSKEKGTGLGMMVVYSIIKAMKGSIKVESEIGKGTTFTLLFPETPFAQLNDVDSADIDNKSKANYGKRHYDLSTIESGEKKCR